MYCSALIDRYQTHATRRPALRGQEKAIERKRDSPNAHLDTTANLELSDDGLFKREPSADLCATANLNDRGTCADSTRSTNTSDLYDAPEINA